MGGVLGDENLTAGQCSKFEQKWDGARVGQGDKEFSSFVMGVWSMFINREGASREGGGKGWKAGQGLGMGEGSSWLEEEEWMEPIL